MSDDARDQQAQIRARAQAVTDAGVSPASAGSSGAISATAGPDETRAAETRTGPTRTDDTRAAETRTGPDTPRAEETGAGATRADETRASETRAAEMKAATTTADATRPAATRADETRAETAEAASGGRADPPPLPSGALVAESPIADTSMWLSHHWPADYDRCSVVAGHHVCRRCLVMYPVALLVALSWAKLGPSWPRSLDRWLLPVLPLPAVVDLVAENLGWARYAPTRQMALTALGSIAAGAGYVRYLDRPGDPLVWGTVLVYGTLCFATSLAGHRRRGAPV